MKITRRQTLFGATSVVGLPLIVHGSPNLSASHRSEPALFDDDYTGQFPHYHDKVMEKVRRAFFQVASGLYVPAYRDPSTRRNIGFAALTYEHSHDGSPPEYQGDDYDYDLYCLNMEKVANYFRSMCLPVKLVSLNLTPVILDPITFEPSNPYVMEWNE